MPFAEHLVVDLNACTPERALVVLMAWISQLANLVRVGPGGSNCKPGQSSENVAAMPNAFISAGAGEVHEHLVWEEDCVYHLVLFGPASEPLRIHRVGAADGLFRKTTAVSYC